MRRTSVWLFVLLLCMGGGTFPARSQAPPEPDPTAQIEEMNRTLREIAGLLRELLDSQQLDQLMKRIELQRRTLAPLEDDLRRLRSERDGVSGSLKDLTAHARMIEEAMEENPESEESYRAEKRQVELQLEVWTEKLEMLEQKVFEMENDLIVRRNEIRDWEDALDEALGLR